MAKRGRPGRAESEGEGPAAEGEAPEAEGAVEVSDGEVHFTWDGRGRLGCADGMGRGCHWQPGDVIDPDVAGELIASRAAAAASLTRRAGAAIPTPLRSNFGPVSAGR